MRRFDGHAERAGTAPELLETGRVTRRDSQVSKIFHHERTDPRDLHETNSITRLARSKFEIDEASKARLNRTAYDSISDLNDPSIVEL